jgi:hypothetical protein
MAFRAQAPRTPGSITWVPTRAVRRLFVGIRIAVVLTAIFTIAKVGVVMTAALRAEDRRSHPMPTRAAAAAIYVRPPAAPNGQPWPSRAAHVSGYPRLKTDGLSSVTVDNSKNDSDVFVKLVSLDGARPVPVRQLFIPAFRKFSVKGIEPGSYDVRYKDLDSGHPLRSDPIELREEPTATGTRFSNVTLTLYRVRGGNTEAHEIDESEF